MSALEITVPRYSWASAGATVMHVLSHTIDYVALGILIACMLLAAAKALPRSKSWASWQDDPQDA